MSILTQANPPEWFGCIVTNTTPISSVHICYGNWQGSRLLFLCYVGMIIVFLIAYVIGEKSKKNDPLGDGK